MNKFLGPALIVAGVLLFGFGMSAADSIGSTISRAFTGSPTDKALWLLIGGAVSAVTGLVMTARGGSRA